MMMIAVCSCPLSILRALCSKELLQTLIATLEGLRLTPHPRLSKAQPTGA